MIKKIQLLLLFAGGFAVGAFLFCRQNRSNAKPIGTSYCFLARNGDLFADRKILTSAQIWVSVHGMSLVDSGCPDGALSFTASRDIGGKVDELNAKLRTVKLLGQLPITFIGTMHFSSRIENAYRWLRYHAGLSVRPDPVVIINQVVSVGEATE